MNFRFHMPSDSQLRQLVRFIAFMEIPPGQEKDYISLFPNCSTNISINLSDPIRTYQGHALQNFMSTSCLETVTFDRSRAIEMLNIQFEPYGIYAHLGIPMLKLSNQMSTMSDFFKASDLEQLYNEIIDAKDEAGKIQAVEDFLKLTLNAGSLDPRICYGVEQLLNNDALSMDQLSYKLNLSSRGLRNLFGKYLGVSPKHFAKLVRFNQATRAMVAKPNLSLTQIALDNGYFDQAHFIKDFRNFGKITPSAFRQLNVKTSDFYNFSEPAPFSFGIT